MSNLLLQTDVYKMDHHSQYPPGTNKVYSYLESRGSREDGLDYTVFFGLQYYLKKYLSKPVTHEDVDEFQQISDGILGPGSVSMTKFRQLADLGYIPLLIRAVPEGTVCPLRNVLMTITNTHPDFAWLVNYVETLLMKLWLPITVASNSYRFRRMFNGFADRTVGNRDHVPFALHDFGYRGCGSEESAAIAGAAHLLSFLGTDTTAAVKFLRDYYDAGRCERPIGLSVPASEHSVMCAWDDKNEDIQAIQNMLDVYPSGIVSIVSDTYNLWKTITDYYCGSLKDQIMDRDGKVVIRPDCYDSETRILTTKGWVLFADLQENDKVAQVNSDNTYEFVKPIEIIAQHYQGHMHTFKDHFGKVDLSVTPNHRMVWYRQDGTNYTQEAEKCGPSANWKKNINRSVSAKRTGKTLTPFERLAVAFQADGSFQSKIPINEGVITGLKCIRFNFTKQRKTERLIDICNAGNFKYKCSSEPARPDNYNIYVWFDNRLTLNKDFRWVSTQDLCGDWCDDFLEELSHWDSTIRNNGRFKFDTTNPDVASVVELVAIGAGNGVLTSIYKDNRQVHFSDTYSLSILSNSMVGGQSIKHEVVEYTGTVYCVKVPSGKILVKRNRCTSVSGNSGDPPNIICGDPSGGTIEEQSGVLRLLDKGFGSTTNDKGFREIDPHIGTIYGDGIFYDRAQQILSRMAGMGYASNQIVFGSGGLLLNQWSRDTLKMAIKATYCEVDGKPRPIEKDPVTDHGKKSKKGLLRLQKYTTDLGVTYRTLDCQTSLQEAGGVLEDVYYEGEIVRTQNLDDIRETLEAEETLPQIEPVLL